MMLLNAKNETNTGTVMRLEPTEIDGIYKISMSTDLTKYTIRLSDDEIDKVRYHLEELYYFCDLLHYSKTLYIRTHDPKYPDKDDIKEFTDIHNISEIIKWTKIYLYAKNATINIGDDKTITVYADYVDKLKDGVVG